MIRLRYDGKYKDFPGDSRQWTILSHFTDKRGFDRFHGSFAMTGLRELGIVKGA